MKIVLEAFQSYVEQRNICGGLNVSGILIVVQGGFRKFFYFIFLCEIRSKAEYYIKNDWELGKT